MLFKPVFSPMASTSRTVQQIPKTKPISNSSISESSKICHVLSDVLRETITDTIYRTVRGQIKKHSALTKQGKCWTVTTQILDHTSSLEVCFDSEVYKLICIIFSNKFYLSDCLSGILLVINCMKSYINTVNVFILIL